jgi:hypothetical protein
MSPDLGVVRRLGIAFGIIFVLVAIYVLLVLGHVFTQW